MKKSRDAYTDKLKSIYLINIMILYRLYYISIIKYTLNFALRLYVFPDAEPIFKKYFSVDATLHSIFTST